MSSLVTASVYRVCVVGPTKCNKNKGKFPYYLIYNDLCKNFYYSSLATVTTIYTPYPDTDKTGTMMGDSPWTSSQKESIEQQ